MDLSSQLNQILLESKEPETFAWMEVRSPLDLPKVKYRYRPPETRTEAIKHRKTVSSEIRKRYIQKLTDYQKENLEQYKQGNIHSHQKLIIRENVWNLSMPDFVDNACPKCAATEPHLKTEWIPEYNEKSKELQKQLNDARSSLQDFEDEAFDLRRADPQDWARIREVEKGVRESTKSVNELEYEARMLYTQFRQIPLTGEEVRMATMHGFDHVYVYSLRRMAKDPIVAQYSRNFDDMVALAIYDLFLNQPEQLDADRVVTYISRDSVLLKRLSNDPERFGYIASLATRKTEQSPQWSARDQEFLDHTMPESDLLLLFEQGYLLDEIRQFMAEHYVEARRSSEEGAKWEHIKDPDTIINSIKRISKNLDNFFQRDDEGDLTLKSEDESEEDFSKRIDTSGLSRAKLSKGSSRKAEGSNMILDLPRRPDDSRETVTDIKDRFEEAGAIPDFAWIILTGWEKSANLGVQYDPKAPKKYETPMGLCKLCRRQSHGGVPAKGGMIKIAGKKRMCPECEGQGFKPAWYWANEKGYEAHPDFAASDRDYKKRLSKLSDYWGDKGWTLADQKDPDIPTPFVKAFKIVWETLRQKGYDVEAFDGVERGPKWESEGEAGQVVTYPDTNVPQPWFSQPPAGQRRPIHSWNSPSYVVILKVKNLPPAGGRTYEDQKVNFRQGIGKEFKKFFHKSLTPAFRQHNFYLEPMDEYGVANYTARIQADQVRAGYSELLGKGKNWSDPEQPSVNFIKNCIDVWSIAHYLDRVGKHSPYLWQAINRPEYIDPTVANKVKNVPFLQCLQITLKHLKYGLSYEEYQQDYVQTLKEIQSEKDPIIRRKGLQDLRKLMEKEASIGSSTFLGNSQIIEDLGKVVKEAEIYDYKWDERLPDMLNRFIVAQTNLQAVYDSHIFGMPAKRDSEGQFKPRGALSKRERIITLGRRIEKIIDFSNINNTGMGMPPGKLPLYEPFSPPARYTPHYQIYLAMGLRNIVPDEIIENNVKSGLYEVVNNSMQTMYAKSLLEKHDIKVKFDDQPESLLAAFSGKDINLDSTDIVEAFYCAQSPNVAVVHLDSAIIHLNNIIDFDMYKEIFKKIDIVFYSGGRMAVGENLRIKNDKVLLDVESGKGVKSKAIPLNKLDSDPTNAYQVIQQCWEELQRWIYEARRRLEDPSKRRLRAAEERRAKDFIDRGGETALFDQRKNVEILNNWTEIYTKSLEGEATPKEKFEFSIFKQLRSLFWDALPTHWLPENNEYRSLMQIKDGFVHWFKKNRPQYRNLELDISGLLNPSVDLASSAGITPEAELKILSSMHNVLEEALSSAKLDPNEMNRIASEIVGFNEK